MRKKYLYLTLVASLVLSAGVTGQSSDPVVLSYQRNFIRASMATKIELLNDASRITNVNMTPLYVESIEFVLDNLPILGQDAQLVDIASVSASKLEQYRDASSVDSLKRLLSSMTDPKVRISVLNAFSTLAKGRQEDIAFLDSWFIGAVDGTISGSPTDTRVLSACATALGKLGASSSFAPLFKAYTSNLDSSVVVASQNAANMITEGYSSQILAIIRDNPVKDVQAALALSTRREDLPNAERGQIAEAVFVRFSSLEGDDAARQSTKDLVRESMRQLAALSWSQASPSVVKFFYRVQGEYKNGQPHSDMMLPVIACMGSMATNEAAQALSIFLGLLNSETEQKKTYNEQLLLAVISSLGELGDKTAFDYLLYVGYLEYPETVKQASRDALARLNW